MPKPTKHFAREVRRVRRTRAWLVADGQADTECDVLDISRNGAKVIIAIPSAVPDLFELVFAPGDQKRRHCEVVWRRGKLLGVKFTR